MKVVGSAAAATAVRVDVSGRTSDGLLGASLGRCRSRQLASQEARFLVWVLWVLRAHRVSRHLQCP